MTTQPLDPEEALAGPLYAVAFLLVVIPAADFILSVATPAPSSVQWRFATVGLLSGFTLTPILGIAIALVIAAALKHVTVQRVLVVACLLLSAMLLILSAGFLLDVLQVGASVPTDGKPAFRSAWSRALVKHLLGAGVLGYLGWRARRMIPSSAKGREPRAVHVVTK